LYKATEAEYQLTGYHARAIITIKESGVKKLSPGEIVELTMKGRQIMLGYLNRQEGAAMSLRNVWLYIGDLATMDEEGYFHISDRKRG